MAAMVKLQRGTGDCEECLLWAVHVTLQSPLSAQGGHRGEAQRRELCALTWRAAIKTPALTFTRSQPDACPLQHAVFQSIARQPGCIGDAQLAFDVLAMGFDSAHRDVQDIRHFLV
jgi:hypothetical protein